MRELTERSSLCPSFTFNEFALSRVYYNTHKAAVMLFMLFMLCALFPGVSLQRNVGPPPGPFALRAVRRSWCDEGNGDRCHEGVKKKKKRNLPVYS